MITGFLITAILILRPQVRHLVNQYMPPAEVDRPKAVLPPPGIKYMDEVEDLVFEITNQIRSDRGLKPFLKDEELRDVARAYSNDMLVRRFFDHTTPEGVPFDDRISSQYRHGVRYLGENIWYSSDLHFSSKRKLAKEIVDDWLSSPGHRENLLSPEFTHLGVGVSARGQTIKVTQEFAGRPQNFNLKKFF